MHASGLFKSLAILMFVAAAGRAAEYSTDITGFVTDPSNLFAHTTFDFGFSFAQIDSVSLEIVASDGAAGGVCSGSSCTFWSVDFALYGPNHPADFSIAPASASVSFD